MSEPTAPSGQRPSALLTSKVPQITVLFWVIKILTTGMGESASDYLVVTFEPVLVVVVTAVLFAIALAVQLRAPRYVPWKYWLVVAMVGIFGTMVADVAHVVLGVPYLVSSAVFALLLAAILIAWLRIEGSISIHTITSRRRELFYWATVVATFALGTALGDMTAHALNLGYLGSAALFAVIIALPGLAYRFRLLGPIAAFWASYIVTRPLGASVADWLGVSHSRGGLGVGSGTVAIIAAGVTAALVALQSDRRVGSRSTFVSEGAAQ
ncbi:COG4705 family protein [Naasia lichenicola]|uniref:Membrane-anchored protein n=1 Tax=Naasia lichenicola TaxID=2565933 RepID=A0A4S4FRA0_9MICO|nr:hypothetical protein [Naasia lichenicola]THG32841.1 hypothetical protein E6C64_00200 [Naasia lichenicola]